MFGIEHIRFRVERSRTGLIVIYWGLYPKPQGFYPQGSNPEPWELTPKPQPPQAAFLGRRDVMFRVWGALAGVKRRVKRGVKRFNCPGFSVGFSMELKVGLSVGLGVKL